MGQSSFWRNVCRWIGGLPIMLAYRIVWAAARLNIGSAREVYRAMWDANLDLPRLKDQQGPTP